MQPRSSIFPIVPIVPIFYYYDAALSGETLRRFFFVAKLFFFLVGWVGNTKNVYNGLILSREGGKGL